jgi:hypothetical protein
VYQSALQKQYSYDPTQTEEERVRVIAEKRAEQKDRFYRPRRFQSHAAKYGHRAFSMTELQRSLEVILRSHFVGHRFSGFVWLFVLQMVNLAVPDSAVMGPNYLVRSPSFGVERCNGHKKMGAPGTTIMTFWVEAGVISFRLQHPSYTYAETDSDDEYSDHGDGNGDGNWGYRHGHGQGHARGYYGNHGNERDDYYRDGDGMDGDFDNYNDER